MGKDFHETEKKMNENNDLPPCQFREPLFAPEAQLLATAFQPPALPFQLSVPALSSAHLKNLHLDSGGLLHP